MRGGVGGGTRTLTTRAIVIAAGARPYVPAIPGIEEVGYLTSDTVWALRQLPQRLVVLGGGPIGSELAQAFARLGSEVTQVEMLPRILNREDPEVSRMVAERFEAEGMRVLVNHEAKGVPGRERRENAHRRARRQGSAHRVRPGAGGRRARRQYRRLRAGGAGHTHGAGADRGDQRVPADPYPNIYACGDVAGPYQFTHTASHQAWYAAVNALFGGLRKFRADYSVIPWATFTDPEVARVGLNETEAKAGNTPYEVTTYGIDDLDRAIADGEAHGMVKVLTAPGTDKVLGATIVGEHAGDLIVEYITAMRHGIGLNKILGTIHIYPTYAEANKHAAGAWKRAHAPERLLRWVERYHAWRRG